MDSSDSSLCCRCDSCDRNIRKRMSARVFLSCVRVPALAAKNAVLQIRLNFDSFGRKLLTWEMTNNSAQKSR